MPAPPKKAKKPGPSAPFWMSTFADMMALLLSFFILILSFSHLDEPTFQKVTGSIKDALGVKKDSMVAEMPQGTKMLAPHFDSIPFNVKERVEEVFKKEIEGGLVTVEEDSAGVVTLRIKDSLAFDFGSAELKESFKTLLNKLSQLTKESDSIVEVGGHTDNVKVRPGAKFTSNWDLSASRAVKVVEYMVAAGEIPAHRMSAAAYADGRPVAVNDSAEGRASNRRVEFKIQPGESGKVFEGFDDLIETEPPVPPVGVQPGR